METLAIKVALAVVGLIVSAVTHVNLPVLGPTPVLGIIALAAVLGIAAAVLWLLRSAIREGGVWLRRRTVTA